MITGRHVIKIRAGNARPDIAASRVRWRSATAARSLRRRDQFRILESHRSPGSGPTAKHREA